MIAPQPISRTLPRWQRIVALTMIGISTALIGGCTMDHNPDTSRRLTGEQKIQLIDSMRNKGSYEPPPRPDHRRPRQCGHPGPNLEIRRRSQHTTV
ncbi:putative conserved lipoprotein lppb [Mycobacterium tuberculosis variant bovis BCG str. ATCC 35743]|nr:putative conserved lipoprotein lppb [Mycobacterium tuberculosis variant bovis BCG str. ATCC 35743]